MYIHLLRSWENRLEERGLRTKTWNWFVGDLVKVTKSGCTTNKGVHLGVGSVGTITSVLENHWICVEFRGYDAPAWVGEHHHKGFKLVARKALRPTGPPPDRNDTPAQDARLVFPKLEQAVPSWNDSPTGSVASAELAGGSGHQVAQVDQDSSTDAASSCGGSETESSDTTESDLIISSGQSEDASSVASSELPDLVPITGQCRQVDQAPIYPAGRNATVVMPEPPCYGAVQYPVSPVKPSYMQGVWYPNRWYQNPVTGDMWGVFQGVMYKKKLYRTNNPVYKNSPASGMTHHYPEKRIDHDGKAYTKKSFVKYYGGTVEGWRTHWEQAKAAAGPSNRGWCNNGSVWRPPVTV